MADVFPSTRAPARRNLVERVCPGCGDRKMVRPDQASSRCRSCNLRKVSAEAKAARPRKPPPPPVRATCPGCGATRELPARWAAKNPPCRSCSHLGKGVKHGYSGHPLYRVWASMMTRCGHHKGGHPSVTRFYVDRGLTVCEEWQADPGAFIRWALANGWEPGLEIDRERNGENYQPDNCRFVTRRVNARNTSRTPPVEVIVEIKTLLCAGSTNKEVAARLGITEAYVSSIKCGNSWKEVGPSTEHLLACRGKNKPRLARS